MQTADIQPILNESALFIKNKKIIVVAEFHIGIESKLRENGLQVPSQTFTMTKRLISILKRYDPNEIILLGDIKHNIPSSTIQERTDVKRFLERIQSYCKIHILPGNHDGNIKKLLNPNIFLHSSSGFIIEKIGFIHGHRWPRDEIMQCEHLIIGHTHPTIILTDRLGYKTFEPCWLKGKFQKDVLKKRYPDSHYPEILVMPAFNPLCGGIAVNKDKMIGPFGKMMDIRNADVYLLDGSMLGKVKDIK